MSDLLENCPFDFEHLQQVNVDKKVPESTPYKTLEDIVHFLELLAKNEIPQWITDVRPLEELSTLCQEGTGQSVASYWSPRKRLDRNTVPKTLFCHDYKGGYLEDRFPEGSPVSNAFTFYNWSCVDIFVYFSHYFITVPPPTWINSGHLHGVPVLGTIITEWKEGTELWNKILDTPQRMPWLAEALARIAETHKFDGYLLNIENTLHPLQMPLIVEFIKLLKKFLTQRLGVKNYLIWYDSVTPEGKLQWQNELNKNNYEFFEHCDGIFLNYTWAEVGLDRSVKVAKERLLDVYVGVDVFGRNFYNDGGFHTSEAVNVIAKRNLSSAVFAFGWTHEGIPGDAHLNDLIFYHSISKYLYIHAFKKLPFQTDFCRGYGVHNFQNGEMCGKPWYNLTKQSLQPSYTSPIDNKIKNKIIQTIDQLNSLKPKEKELNNQEAINILLKELKIIIQDFYSNSKVVFDYDVHDGFNGGGCLKINPQVLESLGNSYIRLFCFDVRVTSLLEILITVKCSSPLNHVFYVVFLNNGKYKKISLKEQGLFETTYQLLGAEACSWSTRRFVLKESGQLLEFGVEVTADTEPILLGEVKINPI